MSGFLRFLDRGDLPSMEPAYHIPLTDDELKALGEICAIQGQIEQLMYDAVIWSLSITRSAADAIMATTSLDAKGHIWLEVIKSRWKQHLDIVDMAEKAAGALRVLTQRRNDFVHAFYATQVLVSLGTPPSPQPAIVYGPPRGMRSSGTPIAIRTRGRKERIASDIPKVRDEIAALSHKFLEVENAIMLALPKVCRWIGFTARRAYI